MTKQELLNKLQSSDELVKIAYVPVSEVIKWVNELEDKATLTKHQIEELTDAIADELNSRGTDLINDYDLEMNYREVELASVDFDKENIRRAVRDGIDGCFFDE